MRKRDLPEAWEGLFCLVDFGYLGSKRCRGRWCNDRKSGLVDHIVGIYQGMCLVGEHGGRGSDYSAGH